MCPFAVVGVGAVVSLCFIDLICFDADVTGSIFIVVCFVGLGSGAEFVNILDCFDNDGDCCGSSCADVVVVVFVLGFAVLGFGDVLLAGSNVTFVDSSFGGFGICWSNFVDVFTEGAVVTLGGVSAAAVVVVVVVVVIFGISFDFFIVFTVSSLMLVLATLSKRCCMKNTVSIDNCGKTEPSHE